MNMKDNRPARIRGISPYSFRSEEWADIVGVRISAPGGLVPRAVFECRYADGVIDYIAISDTANYEIENSRK